MIQQSLQEGNNWWLLMKTTLFPYMSTMVCITWTWSRLLMTIWNITHMSSSLQMPLGTPMSLMKSSSSILPMPLLISQASNNAEMPMRLLICFLPLLLPFPHHLIHRLLKPDLFPSSTHCLFCLKHYIIIFLILTHCCQISVGWGKSVSMKPLRKPLSITRPTAKRL